MYSPNHFLATHTQKATHATPAMPNAHLFCATACCLAVKTKHQHAHFAAVHKMSPNTPQLYTHICLFGTSVRLGTSSLPECCVCLRSRSYLASPNLLKDHLRSLKGCFQLWLPQNSLKTSIVAASNTAPCSCFQQLSLDSYSCFEKLWLDGCYSCFQQVWLNSSCCLEELWLDGCCCLLEAAGDIPCQP